MDDLNEKVNEQSKPSYRPIAARYGLIAALISIGIGLIFNLANLID